MGALRILGGFILLGFVLPMGLSFCFSNRPSSPSVVSVPPSAGTPYQAGWGTVNSNDPAVQKSWNEYDDRRRGSMAGGGEIVADGGSSLVGKCGYNPSDMKFLGRVTGFGALGFNAYGESAPGMRSVTIALPSGGTTKATYPRFLVVKPCP
jgi:hypothetical protein